MPRALLLAAIAIALAALAIVQLGSEALYAQPGSLARALPHSLGVSMYRGFERIAPLPFVEDGLAQNALARDDLDAAQAHALRLREGPRRSDLLGQIAELRGDLPSAAEMYLQAPDPDRFQPIVNQLFTREPGPAFHLQERFCDHLRTLTTHPDALGECYFTLGTFLHSERHHQEALSFFAKAIALAPLNGRYLVTAGYEALGIPDNAAAKALFQRGVDANPANADALAGLGIVAYRDGNRALARSYASRARAAAPDPTVNVPVRSTLEKLLQL